MAGTRAVLSVVEWSGELPEPGDFIRTAAGSCYEIDELRPARPGSKGWGRFICTRLEHDAVAEGDPGVHMWEWAKRERQRPVWRSSTDDKVLA